MSAKSDKCVCCKEIVRPRQEGLECEKCLRWQHRTCNSGITRNLYRKLCKGSATLEWFCEECKSTVAVSYLISYKNCQYSKVFSCFICCVNKSY